MAVVSMSKQEFSRLEVLLRVQSGRLRVSDACALNVSAAAGVSFLLCTPGDISILRRHKPAQHSNVTRIAGLTGFRVPDCPSPMDIKVLRCWNERVP